MTESEARTIAGGIRTLIVEHPSNVQTMILREVAMMALNTLHDDAVQPRYGIYAYESLNALKDVLAMTDDMNVTAANRRTS